MDYLGHWLGEEHQWVTLQNRSLIGSQLRHWKFTLYGHTYTGYTRVSEGT